MTSIKKIRMDYLEHPVGMDVMPEFSWVIESNGTNVVQTAYRLQIAADDAFEYVLYDSKEQLSSESAHVRADDVMLCSCRRYYVRAKVRVCGLFAGCEHEEESEWSETASFVTALLDNEWDGCFISAETRADKTNSKGTYLRKELEVSGEVKEAYICSTALGLYHLYLNGQKVGNDQMAPGWTSYHHQICYQTYDVTDMLCQGANVIGAHLGAGWYKGMMGFVHERNNYGDQTALLLQLVIRYADGHIQTLATDESWLGCNSPVTFSEIYDGERYDARLEQEGWDMPGFVPVMDESFHHLTQEEYDALDHDPFKNPLTDEQKEVQREAAAVYYPQTTLWHSAEKVLWPKGVLAAQPGCRVTIEQEIPAQRLFRTPEGDLVLDFGQNLTGWVRFSVQGNKGELAHIRCFETLDAAGNVYFDNLRGAKAEIRYICKDSKRVTYQEKFSFQGFRYAKLECWPGTPDISDFTACVVHSEMEETGHFSCSNPLVNQLQHNIEWSLRGNFLDVPTDCPQRDERMGWTGDAQIFCRTAAYLRNTWQFFKKWLKDVAYDQTEEGGVPHIVPDTLPFHLVTDWLLGQGTHSAAAWADVAIVNPWTVYLTHGDKRILEQQFDSMKKWIDFMQAHATDYIWNYKHQFGDWVALDAEEGSYYGATPNDLTCTAYYAYSTGLFIKACRALGKYETAAEYEALYQRIVDKFQRTFFDEDGVMTVQTQTAHIVSLHFGLVPENGVKKTVEGLKKLLEKENGHLVTGFVGTPYFCHALSNNGCIKEAYDLLLQEDFPSWLYQVKAGATTIWEHWDGLKPDGTMWSADMNSFNHYAYGAIGEWLYRVAAGIEIDEEKPGYKHAIIAPKTGGDFTFAEASYESAYGTVGVRWDICEDEVVLKVQVPVNTTAAVVLEEGAQKPDGSWGKNADGLWQTEIGSGCFEVRYYKS